MSVLPPLKITPRTPRDRRIAQVAVVTPTSTWADTTLEDRENALRAALNRNDLETSESANRTALDEREGGLEEREGGLEEREGALRLKLDTMKQSMTPVQTPPVWTPSDPDDLQSPAAHRAPGRASPSESPRATASKPPKLRTEGPNMTKGQTVADINQSLTIVPAMELVQQSPGPLKEPGITGPTGISTPTAEAPIDEKHPNMLFHQAASNTDTAEAPCSSFGSIGCPCSYPGISGKVQGWLAIPLVQCMVGSSYVAMVFFRAEYTAVVWAELAVFHLLWFPMVLAYMHCVLVNPGTMDGSWREYLQAQFGKMGDQSRYCLKSGLHKPPRSHFCSVSGRLVLNMDHFCPWIGNTVGFFNRKFFILFLFYVSILTAYTAVCFSVRIVSCYLDDESSGREGCYRIWLFVVCAKDYILAAVLGNFCHFHYQMACVNQTSVEFALNAKPEYDIGKDDNLQQIFGVNKKTWLLPLFCEGPSFNGIDWPTRNTKGLDKIVV